jgi:arabinogalactan endo-1,4-beta-galactosidase
MIGLSYYPWWLKKMNSEVIDDLVATLHLMPERYNRDVIIVEIGGEDEKEDESFDILYDVIEKCSTIPRCKGIFYWEPEGAKIWSNYGLSAWRSDGTPTRAMDAYLSIKQ